MAGSGSKTYCPMFVTGGKGSISSAISVAPEGSKVARGDVDLSGPNQSTHSFISPSSETNSISQSKSAMSFGATPGAIFTESGNPLGKRPRILERDGV